MRRLPAILAVLLLVLGIAALPPRLVSRPALNPDFVHFESSQVHPIAITPDGRRLLVVNTPDARLSVFDLTGALPTRIAEVPVGLEPVSVTARDDGEAWVVNRLSDDVSIVDLTTMNVRATLRVGDEPADVVFAGPAGEAFVSVSEEDAVKVYDPDDLSRAPAVIPIPGRRPRALARSLDGSQVLVDIFTASGGATIVPAHSVGDSMPAPDPPMAPGLPPAPEVGLVVVKNAQGNWVDPSGKIWNSKIPYDVPRVELVYLDAASRAVTATRGDMATTVMGLAVSPVTGAAAVTGLQAVLTRRFEPNLRGRFSEQRLAIVPGAAAPMTRIDLNPHIDYDVTPGPRAEHDSALGLATGVCWSPDGQRVYTTSLVSDKLGVLAANGQLLARVPTVAGPTGVLADPARGRIYVLGRSRNQLQTLSGATLASLGVAAIGFDPTPDAIVNGRKFFYGGFTSGHGDQACASCHLFGDTDHLAWDLGNPRGAMEPPAPFPNPSLTPFHPMKGPMTTQSLRGLMGTGRLHWRGDREDLNAFNPAFIHLMGRSAALPDSEMSAFNDFVMPLAYPPNPHQFLDRTLPDAPLGQASAQRGEFFFLNVSVDRPRQCEDCHRLPAGTVGEVFDRLVLLESQDFKTPQLRNMYTKTGFSAVPGAVNKRGFGFIHDGSKDDILNFLHFANFIFNTDSVVARQQRRDLEAFMMCFDTGMAPAVGHRITFDGANGADLRLRSVLDTLEAQAVASGCELIAKGRAGGVPRGWLREGPDRWRSDLEREAPLATADLIALASAGGEITITGVPLGTGLRAGVDRDRDGYRDGDEREAGSDPGDPASTPKNVEPPPPPPLVHESWLAQAQPNPFRDGTDLSFSLAAAGTVEITVYDVLGRRVRQIANATLPAGPHRMRWDGRRDDGGEAGNGVYFVRMSVPGRHWIRSAVRVR